MFLAAKRRCPHLIRGFKTRNSRFLSIFFHFHTQQV